MSLAKLELIERAEAVTGSLIIAAMFVGWAAASILMGV